MTDSAAMSSIAQLMALSRSDCREVAGAPSTIPEDLGQKFSSLFRQVADEQSAASDVAGEPLVESPMSDGSEIDEAAALVPGLSALLWALLQQGVSLNGAEQGVLSAEARRDLAALLRSLEGLLPAGAAGPASADGTAQVAPSSLHPAAAKVVQAVVSMVGGRGRMVVRLHPPRLGTVWVKVSSAAGLLRVEVKTSRSEAQGLLMRSAGEMRRRLEQAGIVVDRFDVTTFENQGRDGREASTRRGRSRDDFHLPGAENVE